MCDAGGFVSVWAEPRGVGKGDIMFESPDGKNRGDALRRLVSILVSVSLHCLLILVLGILPLVFVQMLPGVDLLTFLVAAPAPPPVPPPPAPPAASRQVERAANAISRIERCFVPPDRLPDGIPPPGDEPPVVGFFLGIAASGMGLPGGSGFVGTITPGILPGLAMSPPVAPPSPPAAPPKTPLRVGGVVQEAKLVRKVSPLYPDIARRARISGSVLLEVTVDEEGNVSDVKVLQGHPILSAEAVRAVRQWKYTPTLLNGEPLPVIAAVTVEFHLGR